MSRKRKVIPLNFWETALEGGQSEKGYCRLSASLLQSPAFKSLTSNERCVYIDMVSVAAGKEVFSFPQAVYEHYGLTKITVIRAIKELQAAGFIKIRENNRFQRKPNVYQFTKDWKQHNQKREWKLLLLFLAVSWWYSTVYHGDTVQCFWPFMFKITLYHGDTVQ